MPLEGRRLIIEPRFPNAAEIAKIGAPPEAPHDEEWRDAKIRNRFWSWKRRSDIVVFEKGGRIDWGVQPGVNHALQDIMTLGCADAWGLEQESRALHLLGTLLPHRRFKQYLLTGMFMETSRRSGTTYLFRRLKPTLAITTRGPRTRILAALCLHPIAYYEGSWAGAMTPTDDVIAHLTLMRGDEKMFWRKANQHAPYRSEAGI